MRADLQRMLSLLLSDAQLREVAGEARSNEFARITCGGKVAKEIDGGLRRSNVTGNEAGTARALEARRVA